MMTTSFMKVWGFVECSSHLYFLESLYCTEHCNHSADAEQIVAPAMDTPEKTTLETSIPHLN